MHRRLVLVLVATILSSVACLAQDDSQQTRECLGDAITQAAINQCAGDEAARADAELNSVYQKLLAGEHEPDAIAKIRAAERAWVVYRDAYIEAMYPAKNKQAEYGSIYPSNVAGISAELTRQQVVALTKIAEEHALR